jgi:hypothetical protein
MRNASRKALQLQSRVPRRGLRRDQQAQGLEDLQDARRCASLARRRSDAGAQTQAAKGVRLAGTSQTLLEAAEAFVDGIASGAIRTKTGERYKPSVVREYERSLRLHVFPTLGGGRLSRIQRRDVQRLADDLLASGADPSTIRNALKPLQVIYRRAIEDGDLAVSPASGSGSRPRAAAASASRRRAKLRH